MFPDNCCLDIGLSFEKLKDCEFHYMVAYSTVIFAHLHTLGSVSLVINEGDSPKPLWSIASLQLEVETIIYSYQSHPPA